MLFLTTVYNMTLPMFDIFDKNKKKGVKTAMTHWSTTCLFFFRPTRLLAYAGFDQVLGTVEVE
jgi:hypothetical protein